MKRFRGSLFVTACVLLNNLGWWAYTRELSSTPIAITPEVHECATSEAANISQTVVPNSVTISIHEPLGAPTVGELESSPPNDPVPEPEESNSALLSELSEQIFAERQLNSDAFYTDTYEQKLATINSLTVQGDDLKLLREILQSDEAVELRVAAVKRFSGETHYAALSAMLDCVADASEELSKAALDVLVSSGDRTVIPVLQNKLDEVADTKVRQSLERAIHTLEYSVTMEMDGL